jgi:preprotein translocase subunit SecD
MLPRVPRRARSGTHDAGVASFLFVSVFVFVTYNYQCTTLMLKCQALILYEMLLHYAQTHLVQSGYKLQ